uniref:Uncharacterized protein n=1 Tax=Kwoniella dejecticola CBS 10117 TaxID=1296121 RepID=A0A1A6AAJ6_9TREE|nr:uncharacterized protein I303_03097 [Kwoniella dejecticola CBS 10117]OBR87074.1 hypothetical protein I303_03097 [Kwoniella dejecticola CBS 10117]
MRLVGTDPTRLIQHLQKLDPTLDQDYFTHLWTLLCAHSSIQVIITNEPILLPGGTTELGTAPLPDGWVLPHGMQADADLSSLYKEGFRGRQIAFMLAGKEFRSDKQAIQDKKEAQKKKAKKAKEATLKRNKGKADDDSDGEVKVDPSGAGILRVLHLDDSQDGDAVDPVPKSDLRRLWDRWGARLRIRCTEDEIYYRLTGSHAKISKITATVFHVLQLAAMSREKGITAIDLGPLVGASQGSMHYFMKVLVGLGLCAKVPAVLHASITNLLVFHLFLDQNPNYCALVGKPLQSANDDNDEGADEPESGDEYMDPALDDGSKFANWGFDFPVLSEADLMAGHAVKQRLLRMLDHPKLQNHLLRTKNLLPALGWVGKAVMRHRRAVRRHIDSLVIDGLIERLEVGEARTSCIRLSKYNPESLLSTDGLQGGEEDKAEPSEVVHDLQLISSRPAYAPPLDPEILNIPLTVTFEHWIIDLVVRSERNTEEDQRGMTINAIWKNTNYIYKRSIDFAILRSDNACIPYHLWPNSMSSFMETIKKERRLRLFTTSEFQRIMLREGQMLEGYPSKPRPELAGDFGDISFKYFYSSEAQLNKFLDDGKSLSGEMAPPKKNGRPRKVPIPRSTSQQATIAPSATSVPEDADEEMVDDSDNENKKRGTKREFKYADSSVQVRGRPRKYIHVVEEDGKINRRIIGTIYSREDLPQVLVYMKERNILVTAPVKYSGIGPPPPPTEAAIQAGHPPEYYYQFPAKDAAAFSGRSRQKSKAAAAAAAGKRDHHDEVTVNVAEIAEQDKAERAQGKATKGKGKKRSKNAGGSASEDPSTQTSSRKSKRQKKDVNYDDLVNHDDDINLHPELRGLAGSSSDRAQPPASGASEGMQASAVGIMPIADVALPASQSIDPLTSHESLTTNTSSTPAPAPSAVDSTSKSGRTVRSSKKKGKAAQETAAAIKQEVVENPKPKRQPRKSKAAQKESATGSIQQSAGLPENGTTSTPPAPGSRFFPNDIPDGSFDRTMEQGIGTVLAELNQSGVRPLPRPTPQAIATASSSAPLLPTPPASEPLASGLPVAQAVSPANPLAVMGDLSSKKRKPTMPSELETPTKNSKLAKGTINNESQPVDGTADKIDGDRVASLFKLPEAPMEETAFELPADIVTSAQIPQHSALAEQNTPEVSIPPANTPAPHSPQAVIDSTSFSTSPNPMAIDSTLLGISGSSRASPIVMSDLTSMSPSGPAMTPAQPQVHGVRRSETPDFRAVTPLREISAGPSTPARNVHTTNSAPYSGTTGRIRNHKLLHAPKGTPNSGRIDLGSIRRANEIVQVLHDSGGALMDTRLLHEHRDWTFKYAGTDHPYAPAAGYGMDRLVVKRMISSLMSEGRVKETIVTVPTPTGRWLKISVIYLADLPHDQLQAYIRQMSTSVAQSMTPNVKKTSTPQIASLPDTPFTELRRQGPRLGAKMAFDATPTRSTFSVSRPFSERRTALLKELKVVGQLLGWKASRCVRVQVLHRAIVKALSSKDCGSVVSSSPRIFAFPLLCEEITAEEWYTCCLVRSYNEDIEHWLRDPQNRTTKLKDVPKQFRPVGGFGGTTTKAKMNTLLQILLTLKIISPVSPVAEDEADFLEVGTDHNGFKLEGNTTSSTFYVLHDMVPIYHIASEPPPFLGLLPAKTEEELDVLWSTIKRASVEVRIDLIGKIGEQTKPGIPVSARFSETLDISADYANLLQNVKRWRSEINLLPIQKAALDEVIDRKTGRSSINTQAELEGFAFENALPLPFLEREIKRRADVAQYNATRIAERLREHVTVSRKRQAKIQQNIREKLIERQELAKQLWLNRIKLSSERKNVDYTDQLVEFVSRQTIQGGQLRMPDVSDNLVDYWVMIWAHVKDLSPEQRESELEERRRIQATRIRLTLNKFVPHAKKGKTSTRKAKVRTPKVGFQRRIRSKRKWSAEDDDILFDGEAIIRARSRFNGYKGRQAVQDQIFTDMASTTLRNRLAKLLGQPGKKAYFEKLEEAWFNLWNRLKGTNDLRDEHPDDPVNFDLKEHIKVLRQSIDKKSLRLLAFSTPSEEKLQAPDLPFESYQVADLYDLNYLHTEVHSFDLAADSLAAEEVRINSIGSISLLEEVKGEVRDHGDDLDSRQMGLLQSSMKVIIGTPDEKYNVTHGQKLLQNWSEGQYEFAINEMLEKNILRKLPTPSRDNERQYGFTQGWQSLNDEFLPPGLFDAAKQLPAKLESEDGFEWPLIGESGEIANLMSMVSNHQVNDDAYEFPVQVKRAAAPILPISVEYPDHSTVKPLCRWKGMPFGIDTVDLQRVVDQVIQLVDTSLEDGITTAELLSSISCSKHKFHQALAVLSLEGNQRVFWAGYDTARLISVKHWGAWCIAVKAEDGQDKMIAPRRWYDLYGKFDEADFEKATECTKSLIMTRPGIPLRTIKEKLGLILDRLELVDILEYLIKSRKIETKWSADSEEARKTPVTPIECVGKEDEEDIALFPISDMIW